MPVHPLFSTALALFEPALALFEPVTEPFGSSFVARAAVAGILVSAMCAMVGTWVVVRGMAFLGDAVSHGLLPGIAVAALIGANLVIGAAVSAAVMALAIGWVQRRPGISPDTAIGLLFVGMLAIGVVVVSRTDGFAVDLTSYLFGDALGTTTSDLRTLAVALLLTALVCGGGHRAFLASSFDERLAANLRLRPRLAGVALVSLMTLVLVVSFRVVGTLLVVGLLVAPPATASLVTRTITGTMAAAAALGSLATIIGLLVSWHGDTAAGATIAGVAVGQFFVVALVQDARRRLLHL
jgi:zinc/manganese transport system permease protein